MNRRGSTLRLMSKQGAKLQPKINIAGDHSIYPEDDEELIAELDLTEKGMAEEDYFSASHLGDDIGISMIDNGQIEQPHLTTQIKKGPQYMLKCIEDLVLSDKIDLKNKLELFFWMGSVEKNERNEKTFRSNIKCLLT